MEPPVDIDALRVLVAEQRRQRGLSLRAASQQSEVPFNTLARVEKGHIPDLANFRRIVEWLGLPPERFFQPSRQRLESTPDAVAHHLARDPYLMPDAAEHIATLVRDLYRALANPPQQGKVHLRAAGTFVPEAANLLADMLGQMQQQLVEHPNGAAGQ